MTDEQIIKANAVSDLINRQAAEIEELKAEIELDEWLENNEIPTGNDYTRTGCMIYCEPYTAERSVRKDILAKE